MAKSNISPREEAYHALMLARRSPSQFAEEFARLKHKSFRGRFDLNLAIYLVSGTLKLQRRLDLILSRFLRKKLSSHSDSLLIVLRLGCFQLLPECNIPNYAAVNETVNLAKIFTPGAESLVNAVLKNISQEIDTITFDELRTDPLNYLSQYYSYPIWFVREIMSYWPEPLVEKFLKGGNDPQPLMLRLSSSTDLNKTFLPELQRHSVRFKLGKYLKSFVHIVSDANPTELPGFGDGAFIIQNEASGLVVELLDPRPGQDILDLCAAPGGKTTDIVERVGGSGSITAVDISEPRLNLLRENLKRLQLENVFTILADGIKFGSGKYHRILVDAPCSGTGVLKKFPEARWVTTREDVGRHAQKQLALLSNACRLLTEDGHLVYSTCSVLKAENENVVERFLKENPEFEIVVPETFKYTELMGEDSIIRTYPGLKFFDNLFAVCLKRRQPGS